MATFEGDSGGLQAEAGDERRNMAMCMFGAGSEQKKKM